LTGRGKSQIDLPEAKHLKPFYVFNDLLNAANFFIAKNFISIFDN